MRIKKPIKYILPLLGVALFIFIIFFVIDIKLFIKTIKDVNSLYFIPVFLLTFPLVFLKAWRWKFLMEKQDINYSIYSSFSMYAVGLFLSLATPGKIGEAVKLFYLNQDNHQIKPSLVTIISDRLIDLIFLIIITFAGLLIFIQYFSQEFIYLAGLFISGMLFLYLTIKIRLYKKIILYIVPAKYHELFINNSKDFVGYFRKYGLKDLMFGLFLTLLSWVIYISQIYLLGLSLGLKLKLLMAVPMIAIANFADLLPISINGIGTRETIFIFFFANSGMPAEKAAALGILQLLIIFSIAIVGFIYWIKKPIKFNFQKNG